jgi:PAS domain S-box-containing protein
MKNRASDIFITDNQQTTYSAEEALGLILNNLEDTFILVDRNLRIVALSEQTKQKMQQFLHVIVSPEMSVLKLAPPERHADLIKLYEQVFKGIEQKSLTELPYEGKKIFIENIFRPARNGAGQIIGAVVSSRDITENKHAEILLKEFEERWRFALEGGKQGVWDWDMKSGQAYYSDSLKKLYGYSGDELADRIEAWMDMIHPDDRERIETAIEEHVRSNDPYYESTYRIREKNGSYKWILARGLLISRDAEGKPLRMIGTHTDITEQVNTEEQLRISNDRYQNVILATSDIIWDWDLQDNLVFWSDNLTRVLGWELPVNKKLDAESCFKHIHPSDRERVEKSLEAVIRDPDESLWHQEFRYMKADGNYAYISDRGYVIRNKFQQAIRLTGAMEDITERKQNEQLLFLERMVFEMSAKLEVSLQQTVQALLDGVCEIYPDAFSSVLLLKDDDTVEPLASSRLPEDFCLAISGSKLSQCEGSCGAAMHQQETVIVNDIQKDPLWKNHKDLAVQYGLNSCWSFPIVQSSGKMMGCFSVYHKKIKSPSTGERAMLERVRNILRILTEHYWSVNEVKLAHERFNIIMKATHDLIWDWNLGTNMVYRDEPGLRKVYGLNSNDPIREVFDWMERLHPEDKGKAEELMKTILESKEENVFEMEYRFRRDDGTYSHVYDRAIVIRDEQGRPVRLIGAAQDVTERKRLEQELLTNELERQKAINQATVDTQEQERSEIGKELHDNVNQVLTTTKLYLDLALTNNELKDELITKSTMNIVSVINEIRQLSRSLMDPSIGDLGLIDSIYDLIQNINLTQKLHVQLQANDRMEDLLNKNQKLTIFRIIQEALNNAIRHAKASHVMITIKKEKRIVNMLIQDDGIGFEPSQVRKGAGLKNIQNRIYLINGSHSIETAPGKGCTIKINFPLTK